jgi:hypothetical protein
LVVCRKTKPVLSIPLFPQFPQLTIIDKLPTKPTLFLALGYFGHNIAQISPIINSTFVPDLSQKKSIAIMHFGTRGLMGHISFTNWKKEL